MQGLAPSDIFLFEDFRFDGCGGLFRRDDIGAYVPVTIGSRALDILGVLIARAGEVVTKDEIIAAVWPETVVEDSNLTVQISALRRALDRGRSEGSCIQTVPGRGYRFAASVTRCESELLPRIGGDAEPRDGDALPISRLMTRVRCRTSDAAFCCVTFADLSRSGGLDPAPDFQTCA